MPVSAIDNPAWSDLLMPSKTVFRYIGPDVAGQVNLAVGNQNYRDPSLWEVTSEPWGYVDLTKNRISVYNTDNEAGNWVVVTEDTVEYSPRRGTSIPGLDAGKTYFIIALADDPATAVDESHYIKLAHTEQNAIDGKAINFNADLLGFIDTEFGAGTSVNNRHFDANDIANDTITLSGPGNTFELGQAVYYYEPGHDDNDTLVESVDAAGSRCCAGATPTAGSTANSTCRASRASNTAASTT